MLLELLRLYNGEVLSRVLYLPGPISTVFMMSLLWVRRSLTKKGNKISDRILSSAFLSDRMLPGEPPYKGA